MPRRRNAEPHSNNAVKTKGKNKKKAIVKDWELYIIDDTLESNWERFLHDLGLGDFKSKTQCKKALKNVWINIHDFLAAVKQRNAAAELIADEEAREAALATPVTVEFFRSQRTLAEYTRRTKRVFPRKHITDGSPLKLLLANILYS